MKQLVFVAVAGLCSAASALAQEGALAPTAPIVPAPVLQNGNVLNSATGRAGGSRLFPAPKWSLLRSPMAASSADAAALPPDYVPALPPPGAVPGAGVAVPAGACADGGCAPGHGRSCWQRFKQWLCFQYSPSDLPKCQPTPYITPLQGLFPCAGCGCGGNVGAPPGQLAPWPSSPPPGQPLSPGPAPVVPPAPPAPRGAKPLPVPTPLRNGAGVMPPRGTSGSATIPSLSRTAPAPVSANPSTAGYRATNWNANAWKSAGGAVVPASGSQK